ncbi:hypothetical protein OROGR_020835 [Orobanche gracilis]
MRISSNAICVDRSSSEGTNNVQRSHICYCWEHNPLPPNPQGPGGGRVRRIIQVGQSNIVAETGAIVDNQTYNYAPVHITINSQDLQNMAIDAGAGAGIHQIKSATASPSTTGRYRVSGKSKKNNKEVVFSCCPARVKEDQKEKRVAAEVPKNELKLGNVLNGFEPMHYFLKKDKCFRILRYDIEYETKTSSTSTKVEITEQECWLMMNC